MGKTINYIIILIVLPIFCFGQNKKLASVFQKDTLISLNQKTDDSFLDGKSIAVYGDEVIFYDINLLEKHDTISFQIFNLLTNKITWKHTRVPGLENKIFYPDIYHYNMAYNGKYLAFCFGMPNSILILKKNTNGEFIFDDLFPTFNSYSYINLLSNNILFLGKCYNSETFEGAGRTIIQTYSLNDKIFINNKKFIFDDIRFSNYSGNHWIDASENRVLTSNTLSYDLTIYDKNFNLLTKINRKINNWNWVDTIKLKKLSKTIPLHNPKLFMDSVNKMEKEASRLEGAYFINDTTILVRYIPGKNLNSKRQTRYYDIWQQKNNTFELMYSDLEDSFPEKSETISNETVPLDFRNNIVYFSNNRAITLDPDFFSKTYGKKGGSDLKYILAEVFSKNSFDPKIFIYKIKLD